MFEKMMLKAFDAPKISLEIIMSFEKSADINLPVLYKNLLLNWNGGYPERNTIWIDNISWSINNYLFLENPNFQTTDKRIIPMGVVFNYEALKSINIENLVPFAYELGGHLFCFDKNKADQNNLPIVLWLHDTDEIIFLKGNFDLFFAALEVEPNYGAN